MSLPRYWSGGFEACLWNIFQTQTFDRAIRKFIFFAPATVLVVDKMYSEHAKGWSLYL